MTTAKKKTLLISISSPQILRNFGLVKDSVLDRLSYNDDIRFVILTKRGDFDPKALCLTGPAEVLVEQYDEDKKRGILERFFHFCYSYLLWTDTTKIVSSYGVRSDKPRPFWRFYNYPFKYFLGNVLGRSRRIKLELVPWLYMKIVRTRQYRTFFERHRPEMVFLPDVCLWPADLEFLVEAKRQGVRTIAMPGNWDHLSKYFIPFRADTLLVWSDEVKDEAVQYQLYAPEAVCVTGAPQADFFIDPAYRLARTEYLDVMKFPHDSILLSFASSGPYSVDGADYIDMVLGWIDEGRLDQRCRIVLRTHPKARSERGLYERYVGHPRVFMDHREGWSSVDAARNYIDFLVHASVVFATYSSVTTDASLFDRPTIITSFDGYKDRPMYQSVRRQGRFTHFQNVIKTGGIRVVERPNEFLRALQEYTARPETDRANRERLRKEVFGPADGNNATRVAQKIIEEVRRLS